MRILLTNDDGVFAPGIRILASELEKQGYKLDIVAPLEEHSGQSHAITLNRSLIIKREQLEGIKAPVYSLSGTPADCVRIAVDQILDKKPDVVFAGCNLGYNAGLDILYSGTVSAAVEANVLGIPSVAVSSEWIKAKAKYKTASRVGVEVFKRIESQLLAHSAKKIVVNINVPYVDYEALKGIRLATVGGPAYDLYLLEKEDNGTKSVRIRGREAIAKAEGTDRAYLAAGYATVSPIIYDFNNIPLLEKFRGWMKEEE